MVSFDASFLLLAKVLRLQKLQISILVISYLQSIENLAERWEDVINNNEKYIID